MKNTLLNIDIQHFINTNLNSNITKLVLKGSPFSTISIQTLVAQIEAKKKCEKKLPTWFSTKEIIYPDKINIEQTSSEITANYKAHLVTGKTLIDLTGGFGVDAFYFSKKIKSVTHCEINEALSKIVKHNFLQLNVNNIHTHVGDGIDFLKNTTQKYDWIYVDPSRRNNNQKVFLLEDCLPNIPENLDILFAKSNHILIKTSPILDIKNTVTTLRFTKEIHVIAVENEVKELLFLLENNYHKSIQVKTVNFNKLKPQYFNFTLDKNVKATYSNPKKYVYEPNAAILKSGAFQHISVHFNVPKLHQHAHLYTSNSLIDFPGRRFEIKHIIPYQKKQLKKLLPNKKGNITTRNFPETVEQIRKKTGIKDGGNSYLFFTTDCNNNHIILICEKV
ncbi:THUMP-like domain-containing protein [Lutibacter sp.]